VDPDRAALINEIYYQELGQTKADQGGLDYWLGRNDLDEAQLRASIREAAGESAVGAADTGDLLADQGFAAFMRKMQFDESTIQSSLQAAQEAAQRRITGQAGQYDYQRRASEEGVNQGFESRGMYRSGGRLGKVHEGRTNIDRAQTEFESGIHEATAKMETDAASSIANLRRERAEQELGARDRLTQRSVVQ